MSRLLLFVLALSLVASPLAHADAKALKEIDALLARLENSNCRFYRNGDWHAATEAKAHLLRKRDALASRGDIANSEQFIELAATRSSVSGETYRVQCGDAAAVASADWLRRELDAMRRTAR